jgi:hypothetical protein
VDLRLTILLCGLFQCSTSGAHHSRSNYDMQTFLEYDGTVVEFAWSNPHAFVVIEIPGEDNQAQRLLLEMNSKPILTGMGWSDDSVAVGDQIHVRGNPDRRADRKQLFVAYVVNRDGEKLWSFGRPRDERERYEAANPVVSKPLIGSEDFAGIWNRARLSDAQRRRGNPFGPADLPVTAEGAAALANFDVNDDPGFECLPNTLPQTIVPVYPMEITWVSDDLLTINYEFNNGYREIHMDATDFPADVAPSRMGYSIGRIEDGELHVRSSYFTYDRWGNGKGVPSGEAKEAYERYSLTNDGKRLEVFFVVTDLEYVQGPPAPQLGAYVLRNNIELSDWSCDPDIAVRHLTGE